MAIVSDEQVIKVLRQYNPWWRNPLAIKEENKPQKRLAYYEALRMISHKTIRRFAVLSGARRVGDVKKLIQWYNILIAAGYTEFVTPTEEENKEAEATTEAADTTAAE